MQECAQSKCQNILELVETFEDHDKMYIVTKFMPAGDLLNYSIKQPSQPLTEASTRKIIVQVALGIQGLHERLIIHRDIKIENILMSDFTEEAKVRIGDLGSAAKLASVNDTSQFMIGTLGYIAPEVLRGEAYSFPCDIWSLGCLLFVLLSARPPFWNEDKREFKTNVVN